jgi:hypothetical protein
LICDDKETGNQEVGEFVEQGKKKEGKEECRVRMRGRKRLS